MANESSTIQPKISLQFNEQQIKDVLRAYCEERGYVVDRISISYDQGGGTQFDSGSGASATVYASGMQK